MHLPALLGLVACLIAGLASPAPARSAKKVAPGAVSLTRNATPDFTRWLADANRNRRLQRWMRAHYDEMRGYAPYFTHQTFRDRPPWKPPPSQLYTDAFIMSASDPPAFRLKNAARPWEPVFIDLNCPRGCPAYAGDIGNPAYRAWWISEVAPDLADGYRGIYVDDVNMALRSFESLSGAPATALDPRTGAAMTELAARRYAAEFIEAINAAFPATNVLANNNQWWVGNDPQGYHRRAILAADVTELERGYSVETAGGTGTFGYESKLHHVDWIHSLDRSVLLEPYLIRPENSQAEQRALAELELASYFLTKRPGDAIATDWRTDRDNWWHGWEVDLGRPTGPWEPWNGLFRRDFVGGMALVNQPQEPIRTVDLPGTRPWQDLDANRVQNVTLGPRRGKVLLQRIPTRVRRLHCAVKAGGHKVRVTGVLTDVVGDALTAAPRGQASIRVQRGGSGRPVQVAGRRVQIRRGRSVKFTARIRPADDQQHRARLRFLGNGRYLASPARASNCT